MDSICVFCGSRDGARPAYLAAARETGAAIARRGWRLIYGGGHVGIMGALANAALAEGGEVIGVMPRALLTKEIPHPGITRIHIVTSMHRRKALMSSLSDGYLTLPGGFGTLEEFFETLTWAQLGLHSKPCALLDVAGFWDPLLAMLDMSAVEGFVSEEHLKLILNGAEVDPLLDRMDEYVPPEAVAPASDILLYGPPLHRDLPPELVVDGGRALQGADVRRGSPSE
jgi:uncharacterized protein (TIGR00730 family)